MDQKLLSQCPEQHSNLAPPTLKSEGKPPKPTCSVIR